MISIQESTATQCALTLHVRGVVRANRKAQACQRTTMRFSAWTRMPRDKRSALHIAAGPRNAIRTVQMWTARPFVHYKRPTKY